MERSFHTALALDPHHSHAGADRCLGLLYRDAPGWPISVGSRSKARHHLERACQLAPEYPENQLNLLEAYEKWGEKSRVRESMPRVREVLEQGRLKFAGDDWTVSWEDWDRRWKAIQGRP
jgi:hypothetical protein